MRTTGMALGAAGPAWAKPNKVKGMHSAASAAGEDTTQQAVSAKTKSGESPAPQLPALNTQSVA